MNTVAAGIVIMSTTILPLGRRRNSMRLAALFCILIHSYVCHGASIGLRQPFAIVEPVEGQSKLKLNQEGLSVLKQMRGPIVPVVVIGPYRSGKSFTLNQLMEVPCDEGFGVGHSRHTQTKGIWVWGEPLQLMTY